MASEPAPPEAPLLRIQGARITYNLPPPNLPLRPLPWQTVEQRLHANSLAAGIIRAPGPLGVPPLPGPTHPWRKPVSSRRQREIAAQTNPPTDADSATETEDTFTGRLNGQNH